MATVTRYEIGAETTGTAPDAVEYPALLRIITVNGKEVARDHPSFIEAQAVDPSLLQQYHSAISMHLNRMAEILIGADAPTEKVNNCMSSISIISQDYTMQYERIAVNSYTEYL